MSGPLMLFSEEIYVGAELLMFGNNPSNIHAAIAGDATARLESALPEGTVDNAYNGDPDARKKLSEVHDTLERKYSQLTQADIEKGLTAIPESFKKSGEPYYVDAISSGKEGVTKDVGIINLNDSAVKWTADYKIATVNGSSWGPPPAAPGDSSFSIPKVDDNISSYANNSATIFYAYEDPNYKGEYIRIDPYTALPNLKNPYEGLGADNIYTKDPDNKVLAYSKQFWTSGTGMTKVHIHAPDVQPYTPHALPGKFTNSNWSDRISSISVVPPGTVSNGPIDGATVYWDANFNGQIDADELIATSDQGRFLSYSPHERFDTNGDDLFDTTEGRLVATGGTHTLGGMPLRTDLWAPAGSTMITPLTTIVEFLAQSEGMDYDATEALIKQVVGIHADVDIQHFDPVLYLEGGERLDDATSTYIAHIQVGSLLESITQYLSGALGLPLSDVGELAVGVVADGLITLAALGLELQDIEENHDVFAQAFVNHLANHSDASNFAQLEVTDTEFIADVFVQTLSFIEEEIATIDTSDGQALLDDSATYKPILYTVIPELLHEVGDEALTLATAQERLDKVIAESKDGHVLTPSESGVAVGTVFEESIVGFDGDDTLAGGLGNDQIFGGDGNDVLRGDDNSRSSQGQLVGGNDDLYGGNGDDRLGGKAGNDRLYGDQGNDMLWGDDGDDLLWGGLGNDTLTGDDFSGGQGADIFVLALNEGTDTIVDFEVGIDFIGLAHGLTLGQVEQMQQGRDLLITANAEVLAVVNGVNSSLSDSSFIAIG